MINLRVKDLMTPNPVCIDIDENMLSAARLMMEKNIKHLIVTSNGETTGILSDRDVNRAIKADRTHNNTMDLKLSDKLKVREFMNWPVFTISETASIKFALEQLILQKISALVVEDKDRKITGIVTTNDFLGMLMVKMQREEDDQLRGSNHLKS